MLRPLSGDGPELARVALDIGWFPYRPDEGRVRGAILEATGLDAGSLLFNISHTHSGANVNSQLGDSLGGALVEPFLERLADAVSAAIGEARERASPAWITYGYGHCALL